MDGGGQYRSYSILFPSTDLIIDLVSDFGGGHYNYGVHVDESHQPDAGSHSSVVR